MAVGRNDPCPCGSGKKYKKCCGLPKEDHTESVLRLGRFVLAAVILIAAVAGARALLSGDEEGAVEEVQRIWSVEHNHWHVIGGGEDGSQAAPPGKIWSHEHGHWHDAPLLARRKLKATAMEERLNAQFEAAESEVVDDTESQAAEVVESPAAEVLEGAAAEGGE